MLAIASSRTSYPLVSRADDSAAPSCTTAVPGKNGHVDDLSACNAFYNYNPSFEAAVLFAVLFALVSVAHIAQAFIYKKRFTWVIIMGVLWELASFIARSLGSKDQQSEALATVAQILFLLAPLWINAFVYMTLGRLIHFFHPERRCYGVKASSIAKYFVWADIVSFLIQAAGGLMLNPGSDASAKKLGLKIYMVGVGTQEGFILVFTVLGVKFMRDMSKFEKQGLIPSNRTGWRLQISSMFVVLALITMRIIFRLCEFTKGVEPGNPVISNEAFIYALDAAPMFLAILLLSTMHPGRVLVGPESEFPRLSRKEKKILKQDKKEQRRQKKEEKLQRKAESKLGFELRHSNYV